MREGAQARAVFASKLLSDIGQYLDSVILSVYLYQLTRSAASVGAFMACRMAGAVVAAYLSGKYSELGKARSLMIGADVTRAGALGALLLSPAELHASVLFPVIFVLGAMRSVFNVAFLSSAPALFPSQSLSRLNAWWTGIDSLATVLGAALAAIVLEVVSYQVVFAYDALSYLVSALAVCSLRPAGDQPPAVSHREAGQDGIARYLLLNKLLLGLLVVRFFEALSASANMVAYPVFSRMIDPANPAFIAGVIMAAWGLGKMTGAYVSGSRRWTRGSARAIERVYLVSVPMTLVFFLSIFVTEWAFLIAAAAYVAGIFDACSEISFNTLAQSSPPAVRGRLLGLATGLDRAGLGLGMILAGVVLDRVPVPGALAGFYLPTALLCCAIYYYLARGLTKESNDETARR